MSVESVVRQQSPAATTKPGEVMAPALYSATITHHRRTPLVNRFRYRSFYWLIDIDDIPALPRWLREIADFPANEHLDIRAVLADAGVRATRILRLAHARSFGAAFNPLSVYWCYDPDGALLVAVAEVHNTYGGRHAYLLRLDDHGAAVVDKKMLVSPFYPVDGHYQIRLSSPAERVAVTVTLHRHDNEPFTATLVGDRVPLTRRGFLALWFRHPFTPLRTSMLIRWQGIRLWRRGLPVLPR